MDYRLDHNNMGGLTRDGYDSFASESTAGGSRRAETPGSANPRGTRLADAGWFQIMWFSAAMLCLPALIAVLALTS